ncbi:MAG: hypothetical protein HYR85_15120 [Planctomycetes bacterium]|nr:hypothetical protein [Planctomycetota bacterium]MBI3846036.1 hypothetical protein [Planctomycetota bacterium]
MPDRNPLKQKYPKPAESTLPSVLGSERMEIVQRVLDEMRRRSIAVALEWTGPDTGWSYVSNLTKHELFTMTIADTPIFGRVDIPRRRMENAMIADPRLSDAGRMLLESIENRGDMRWIEVEIRTRDDVDAFLDVVLAKHRAIVAAASAVPKTTPRRKRS